MAVSYKAKILIDHTLGVAVAVVFKLAAKALSVVLRRDHSVPTNPKSIVVAKLVGLGSIVYTGVLCRALREKFPSAKIIYITSLSNKALAERLHGVDEVLCIKADGVFGIIRSGFGVVFGLWRFRPELYFDLEVYSSFSAILATLSLARNRYGLYRKNAGFKKNLHTHMIFFNTQMHVSEIYSQLALCVPAKPRGFINGVVEPTGSDREQSDEKLRALGLGSSKVVLVNMNASELLLERRWPTENWIKLLSQAVERLPEYAWLLVGSTGEARHVSQIYDGLGDKVRGKVHNVAGEFSLGEFLGLVEKCDLMITNDSGPLHIAVALGRPTVSIWGPVSPNSYGPREGVHEVIYTQTYCSPCLHQTDFPPCEGNNVCVKRITVSSVLQATERILCGQTQGDIGSKNASLGDAAGVRMTYQNLVDFNPVILHGNFDLWADTQENEGAKTC